MISSGIPYADLAIHLAATELQVDPATPEGRTAVRDYYTNYLHEHVLPALVESANSFQQAIAEETVGYDGGKDPKHLTCMRLLCDQMIENMRGIHGQLGSHILIMQGLTALNAEEN